MDLGRDVKAYAIRRAREEDMEMILSIEKASFPRYPYPREVFDALLKHHSRYFLVAEHEDKVFGYVCGRVIGRYLGEISSIAIVPEWRRKGIGKTLMLELESRFKADGIKIVLLEVDLGNSAAINLYKNLGYGVVGRIRGYYSNGSDALTMVKNI